MRYTHEEIREMIPEYSNGFLTEERKQDIEVHLQECQDCSGDLALLAELRGLEVPDPGDLYWGTLPGKVIRLASGGRGRRVKIMSLIRPIPAFLSVMILAVAVLTSVLVIRGRDLDTDPFFEEPLVYSELDLHGVTEDEMPAVIGELPDDSTLEMYVFEESDDYSYHMDIAFLDQKEFESLYDALEHAERKEG